MSNHGTKERAESQVGRKLPNRKTFKSDQTFRAYHLAEAFCRERGYSVGRMCGDEPTGIKLGSYDIQKWRNLSFDDRKLMDGVLIGEFREGPVTVLFDKKDVEAHKAELAAKAARTYKVKFTMKCEGIIEIEADSLEDAKREALLDYDALWSVADVAAEDIQFEEED